MTVPHPRLMMLTHDQTVDRRILLQAQTLADQGWQVQIMTLAHAVVDDELQGVEVIPVNDERSAGRVKFSSLLKLYKSLKKTLGENNPVYRRIKAYSLRHFAHPEQIFSRLFLPTALQYSADVVMAHDLPMLPVACQLAKAWNAKLVYDSHELFPFQDFSPEETRLWRALEVKYIHKCDLIITINPAIAELMQQAYGLDDIHVIHNAARCVALPQTKPRYFHRQFKLPQQAKVLLYQGCFSANRHLLQLIQAMDYVQDEQIHLVLLGDGKLASKLRHAAARSPRAAFIHFHPRVSQHDLLNYTMSADVGIIPYQATCQNNLYCTPNKLYEFIAAGLPVLATDLPQLREIITQYDMGLVGATAEPQQLAELIETMLTDEQRLTHFRQATLAAREQLNWQQESQKFIRLFETLRERLP